MAGKLKDRVVWITGASSGLGLAVAAELVSRGSRVAISARRESILNDLADRWGRENVLVVPLDVTDREANLEAVRKIESHFGRLDIAFLNAGTCEYLDVHAFDSALFERQIRTNFLSLVYGVEAALPALRRSPHGQIVGMSSTARYGGLPRAEAYGASKAAGAYFMESLRLDLLPDRIPVSVVSPGFVRTPLTDKNDFPMPMLMEPDRAARIIADGIEKQRKHIQFPLSFSLLLQLLSILPAGVYTQLMKRTVRGL